jgi:type I restriction-modification system DNA methylase subunit
MAKMNLAIRGISANLGEKAADTFSDDQHKDLKADFIMANPPFNQKTGAEKRSCWTTRAGEAMKFLLKAMLITAGYSTWSLSFPKTVWLAFFWPMEL